MNKRDMLRGREVRRFDASDLELRETNGQLTLTGWASVTERSYDMGWYQETISRGAFRNTLSQNPDVQLLLNHEGIPLARTTSGTLRLVEDERGLRVEANLDPNPPRMQDLTSAINRGDIDQMSFAFRVIRQTWGENDETRTISEVDLNRGDVSVVNQGANPATSFSMRDFTSALMEVRAGKALSASTLAVLTQVLALVSASEENLDTADTVLAALIGVPDPEPEANSAPAPTSNLSLYAARAFLLSKKSA